MVRSEPVAELGRLADIGWRASVSCLWPHTGFPDEGRRMRVRFPRSTQVDGTGGAGFESPAATSLASPRGDG
jgi:hypothetical protein